MMRLQVEIVALKEDRAGRKAAEGAAVQNLADNSMRQSTRSVLDCGALRRF